jgi:hypothetical protein
MTRRVPPSARADITRVTGTVHRRTISRGSDGPASSDWLEGDLAIVGSALGRVADQIAADGMAAFSVVLERVGLRCHVGKADALRAIREYVFENLYDALRERVTEMEAQPTDGRTPKGLYEARDDHRATRRVRP